MPFVGKQAVLFDAGFTLVEPAESVPSVYCRCAREMGVDVDDAGLTARIELIWNELDHRFRSAYPELVSSEALERQAWHDFTALVAEPFVELSNRHARWLELLVHHFDAPSAWQPLPGVIEILGQLESRGIRLAVVSNWHSALHGILHAHKLHERFEFVLTSAEAGRKKPHPAIFHEALRRLGVAPHQAVHIGDSLHDDVGGATAAGLSAVLLTKRPPGGSPVNATVVSCLADLAAYIEASNRDERG